MSSCIGDAVKEIEYLLDRQDGCSDDTKIYYFGPTKNGFFSYSPDRSEFE